MASPEKPTLIERFVQLIPLPYTWAAVAWTIILGPPGGVLFQFIDTGSVRLPTTLTDVFNNVSLVAVLFYLFSITRYLRSIILRAEQHIVPILERGERDYDSAFERLSSLGPVIVLTIIFSTLEISSTVSTLGPSLPAVWLVAQYVVIGLGLATFIWEYSVFNWGLHRLGVSQLRLRSFLEDRMMGAKPIGNAALSSTIGYLGGLLLTFLLGTSNPRINGPGLYVVAGILLVLGVVMFFLPLNSLHRRMQAEKVRYAREMNQRFLMMSRESQYGPGDVPGSKMKADEAAVQLVRLKEYEITEQKLTRTPTWPFDVQVLAKLTTISLSVTAVLLTRVITDYLIRI